MNKTTISLLIGTGLLIALPALAGPYEDGLKGDDERNYAVSFPAFKKAAAEGHAKAYLKLGNHYTYGKGTKKSATKAIEAYKKAADLGESKGLYEIGYIYQEGIAGVTESHTKALEWYKKAAEAGYFLGQYKLGNAHRHGNGIGKDEAKAAYWYSLAAAQGHMMSRGGLDALKGQGVVPWSPPPAPVAKTTVTSPYTASTKPVTTVSPLVAALKLQDMGSNGYDKCTAETPAYNMDTLIKLCDNSGAMYATMVDLPSTTDMQKNVFRLKSAHSYTKSMEYRLLSGAGQDATCKMRKAAKTMFERATQAPPGGTPVAKSLGTVNNPLFLSMCKDTPANIQVKSVPVAPSQVAASSGTPAYDFETVKNLIDAKKYEAALRLARPAANAGNAKAQRNMGFMYLFGKGVKKSPEEAFKWFEKAALQGEPYAQNKMAEAYYFGTGTSKDAQKYRYWVEKAAHSGSEYAQFSLGLDYYEGAGVPQSDSTAFKWYLKSAEQGHVPAQLNVSIMYDTGQGVARSFQKSLYWTQKAAEQGEPQAQHNLGIYYLHGQGLPQSYTQAAHWFLKSAKQGNKEAQLRIAYLYYDGEGIEQSNTQAAHWAEKSAVQGWDHAQYLTAMFYELGIGVIQNVSTGLSWYKKAAAQGHVEAREAVQFYNAKMSDSRVNTVGQLINMDKINKIRAERKRCMRPIGTTDYLRQKRLQTGQTYEWVKPYGCP